MPEIIGVYDGGFTFMDIKGEKARVGVINLRIVRNEVPEIITGYCHPYSKNTIIRKMEQIVWQRPEEQKPKIVYPESSNMTNTVVQEATK